ncbi:hypothetical protein [Halodurantibacterium flavum]|uniref:L-lactate permease n=1 Tax=Halodurantibacterium flavum TaxID=1382802 RepID=A0ABW4S4C5_9RHOB
MSQGVMFFAALMPVAVVFLLLVVMRWSAKLSMLAAYVVTVLLALVLWGTAPERIGGRRSTAS